MNRSNAVGAALLVVGLLLGGLIVERAGAQAKTTKSRTWPPEPEDIVHLRDTLIGIDDGAVVPVFVVPNDRWLILTDIRIGGYGESDPNTGVSNIVSPALFALHANRLGTFSVVLDGGGFPSLSPGMNPSGVTLDGIYFASRVSGASVLLHSSVTGIAFEPGTALEVRYSNPGDAPGDSTQAHAQWNLIGYLTDR